MPAPYLLHVNSRPRPEAGVDDRLWTEWYTNEHIPDLVDNGVAVNAAFYEERQDLASTSGDEQKRKFLAIYLSNLEEPLKSKEFNEGARSTSDRFPQKKVVSENGDFDGRNYKLVQGYDSLSSKPDALPVIITIELDPEGDINIDEWCHEQHLELARKVPGYIRTLQYLTGPQNALSKTHARKFLIIHGFDKLGEPQGEKNERVTASSWAESFVNNTGTTTLRVWDMVFSYGA